MTVEAGVLSLAGGTVRRQMCHPFGSFMEWSSCALERHREAQQQRSPKVCYDAPANHLLSKCLSVQEIHLQKIYIL